MATAMESGILRIDITEGLQTMAKRGRPLEEMVSFVQQELGHPQIMVVPVLAYFCQAFSLPLAEVLPLREWLTTHDDREISGLLTHLQQWVCTDLSPAGQTEQKGL